MKTDTKLGMEHNVSLGGNAPAFEAEETVPVELAKGITTEQMKAVFFNATVLREPNYSLHQLNSRGKRYYYIFDGDEPVFFPSVTTILHNVMPENKVLTDWKLKMGKEAAEAYTMEKARYGTFLHGQIGNLMISGRYNLDELREKLCMYAEKENLPISFVDMYEDEAKADLVAFAKWMRDYEVEPLAVEVSLYSQELGCAGSIDCVCTMRLYSKEDKRKMATDERIAAIVDFKSGRKGFYDDYAVQLELYRRMWNENFPDLPIDRIFNIAPKDWRGTVKKVPSYSFEEQTENPILKNIPYYLGLFHNAEEDSRKITLCNGVIDLTSDELDNVQILTLTDLVKNRSEKETEEVEEEVSDPNSLFN